MIPARRLGLFPTTPGTERSVGAFRQELRDRLWRTPLERVHEQAGPQLRLESSRGRSHALHRIARSVKRLNSLERGTQLDRTRRTARHPIATPGLLVDCGPPAFPCPPSGPSSSSGREPSWPSGSPPPPRARTWSRRPSAGPHDRQHGFSTGASPRQQQERHDLLLVHQRLPPSAALRTPRFDSRAPSSVAASLPRASAPRCRAEDILRRRSIHRRREEATKVVMAGMRSPPAAACLDTGCAAPGQARRLHHVYRTQTRPTSRGDLGCRAAR